MTPELLNTIYLSIAFLALFAIAEVIHLYLKVKAEITRKIVHIGTGILTMFFPVWVKNPWLVLFLCSSFAVILTLSLRFHFLKGINSIDRKSHGSISYPIAVFLAYLFYYFQDHYLLFFYLPILTMAICDPMAALVGRKTQFIPVTIFGDHKTIGGFLGFFGTSILVTYLLVSAFPCPIVNNTALLVFCAVFSAVTELITPKGFDNITIPLGVIGTLIMTQYI